MPKVTKITYQKKNSEKVNIFVDDKFFTGIDYITWVQYGLKIGDTLTDNQLNIIKDDSQIDKAYSKALKLLSMRPQSELEIKQKLSKYFDKEVIGKILEKLESNKLVDDYEFAKLWVKERSKTRLRSKRHLMSELKQKGINQNIIKDVLGTELINQNEIEAAKTLLAKKLRQEKTNIVSQKIKAYLAGRGFDYKTIVLAEKELQAQDLS